MKAMILAAGEGTRLRPLTLAFPKPMVPVAGVPLLQRTVALLQNAGISQIAVNLFHRPESIETTFGDALHYSHENELLGTAGGVKKLENFFDTTFLVLYGDNYYKFDPAPLLAFHKETNALATLATFTTPNPTACGLIETDDRGKVTRFVEKPPADEVFTDQASAGVYVLEPQVLSLIPSDSPCDFGRDVFPALLREFPGRAFARPLDGYLKDTGTPENYRQANWDALQLHSERAIAPDAWIASGARLSGRNVIGASCRIESGASLTDCILWDGVTVGAGARLENVVLGHGVRIGPGVSLPPGTLVASGEKIER
jgi:NDP-sugar pyrophosphorylase family protein